VVNKISVKKIRVKEISAICMFLIGVTDFPDPKFRITGFASFIRVYLYLFRTLLLNKFQSILIGYFFDMVAAFSGNSIVGLAYFAKRNDIVTLHGIVVKENFRNQGVGTSLLRKILFLCQSQNVDLIKLYVSKHNLPAITLYQAMGFKIKECSQKNFLMTKTLVRLNFD
jgi:ribosomal protein S18 acetylase RimI-like enzyme